MVVAEEVADAVAGGLGVVALESTLISHGLPSATSAATARRIEALTPFLPDKICKKNDEVIQEIHAIRKRSGKVRDLDVQLNLLHKVGSDAQRPTSSPQVPRNQDVSHTR